jgi:hypothetical protein
VEVRIEAITIRGVTGFDPRRFEQALSGELGRLAESVPAAGGTWQVARIELEIEAQAGPAAAGVAVARAIFEQMKGRVG